jgi:hypothetical protein
MTLHEAMKEIENLHQDMKDVLIALDGKQYGEAKLLAQDSLRNSKKAIAGIPREDYTGMSYPFDTL